ncbi:MAG: divalent-cation tolerance protein CutA [Candidatus Kapaibacterium sp.]
METFLDGRLVLISVDTRETATTISRMVVSEGLAACCTILPGARSVYTWNGAVEEADEALILMKTDAVHLDECERVVRAAHPYATMEMVSWKMEEVHGPYRAWMRSVLC